MTDAMVQTCPEDQITREGEHRGGGDNGSREKKGKEIEKSGQKHRSKHLKDH